MGSVLPADDRALGGTGRAGSSVAISLDAQADGASDAL